MWTCEEGCPNLGGREFAYDRAQDWKTTICDAQGGLEYRPVADLAHAVGEVCVFPNRKGEDAQDRNDAYLGICVRNQIQGIEGERWGFTSAPTPNMNVSATFLPAGICKPHSAGMGRMTMVRSVMRLMTPTASYAGFVSAQCPGMFLFQLNSNGRQRNPTWKRTMTKRQQLTAIVV